MKILKAISLGLLLLAPIANLRAQELTAEDFYASAERLYEEGSFTGAIGHLDLAIEHQKEAKFYKLRADAHQKTGRFEQALADYNFAVRRNFEDHSIYLNRAVCKINLELFDEAILDIYEYLKSDAESPVAFYYLAVVDFYTFNYKGALDYIENVTSLDPDYMEAYYLLGAVYGEMGKLDKALDAYGVAYDIDPQFHRVMLNIGALKLQHNDPEGALEVLEPLEFEMHDFGPELFFYIAEARYALKDKDGACEAWKTGSLIGDEECKMNYNRLCLGEKGEKVEKRNRLTRISF